MIGDNFLLDTNIVIEIFDGNKMFADKVRKLGMFYLPSVVLGELYTGINRVANKAKHLKKLTDFLDICTVVNIDSLTAKYYGETIASLYKKGKLIPTNDVWIAALALQHGFTLITTDGHFKEITRLQIKKW
jgi:tRNA(fMet)-specific endonuclease VapC